MKLLEYGCDDVRGYIFAMALEQRTWWYAIGCSVRSFPTSMTILFDVVSVLSRDITPGIVLQAAIEKILASYPTDYLYINSPVR